MKHHLVIGEKSSTEKKQRYSAPAFAEESSTEHAHLTEPLIVAGDAPPVPAEWPPVWKPIEESPQTKLGLLLSYQFIREALEKCDDSMSIDPRNKIKIKEFIDQVLASRDHVEVHIKINEVVDHVVLSINAEAAVQKRDERYEFHQLEKVVEARFCPSWYFLVTFTVREGMDRLKTVQAMVHNPLYSNYHLEEWRFKPFTPPEEAKIFKPLDWYKPPRDLKPNNNAMAGCDLPLAVVTRIISFLPVETWSECKLVCKAWRNLIMSNNFYGTCCQLLLTRKNLRLGE